MSYLNFALEVAALPDGKFRINAQSPVGEASVDADNPFSAEEIETYQHILSREKRVAPAEALSAARDFGQRLFYFLIRTSSPISNAYFASLRDSASADGLRIRLTVDQAGTLSQLPWEFLRDPSNDFLALSRRTPVVRYTQQLDTRAPASVTLPLRVLVMISAPQDFPTLDVEGEWQRLQEATAPLQQRGLILLERLNTATLIALQHRLRAEDYHIFHYIGHSDYDSVSQQGVLVFEHEGDERKGQIISGTALSRELAEESTVRLVVLNSCQSAQRPPADALAGISSSLITRGIPAVVAMQYAISDTAAKAFTEEFYRAISELMPLDAAMSEARRAVANRAQNNEWATPVLFMRSDDGVLFQPTAQTTPAPAGRGLPPRTIALGIFALLVLALLAGALYAALPRITPTPAALPDLQIGNMRISPSQPAPGQIFILSITILNAGSAPSGPFNWSWDASLGDPVILNALDGHIDNILPGASKNISFPFSYGWWGTYNSQLKVDVDSQVVESDDRNNNRPFTVAVALQPFDMDFSLLPSNQLVDPPMQVPSGEYAPWSLDFSLNTEGHAACASTPLELVGVGDDIVLTNISSTPECASLPLSVRILRGPVATAQAEIVPTASGTATLTYYGDTDGQQELFQSQAVPVQAGVKVRLGDTSTRAIRRIDISVPGQAVQLTRLILTPRDTP